MGYVADMVSQKIGAEFSRIEVEVNVQRVRKALMGHMLFIEEKFLFSGAAVTPYTREAASGTVPEIEPGVNAALFQPSAPAFSAGVVICSDSIDDSGVKEAEILGDDLSEGEKIFIEGVIPIENRQDNLR
jgi:hypothetical protein